MRLINSVFYGLLSAQVALSPLAIADSAPVVDFSGDFEAQGNDASNEAATPVFEPPSDGEMAYDNNNNGVSQPLGGSVAVPQSSVNMAGASDEQRLSLLERQVNNIANMRFAQDITLLQQQLAQLRGQVEVQSHQLQLLGQELKNFYQDLDKRVAVRANDDVGAVASADKAAPAQDVSEAQVKLQDNNAYQAAFTQLTKRQYVAAKKLFSSYIDDYPDGKYIADAHYWLGEIYIIDKDYQHAEKVLHVVLTKYPKSFKAPDAELKMAMIHASQGNSDQAKIQLQDIIKRYPDSAVAQLANIRLQQLQQ